MSAIPGFTGQQQPVSAIDAIVPAFRRVRSILAEPFRLGFFLKLCLIFALAEAGFVSASFSYPIQGTNAAIRHAGNKFAPGGSGFLADGLGSIGALGVGLMLLILAGILIAVLVWVVMIYLFCRLRFTALDLALYREGRVRQAWRKYRRQGWRYFGLTLLVGLVFLLVMAAVLGPFVPAFIRIAKTIDPSHPNPVAIFGLMLPLLGAIIFLSILWWVVDAVVRDFLLPPMAIEDAPIERAMERFFTLLRAELGQVSLYLLMRLLVTFALSACLWIAAAIPLGALALICFGVGIPLYHSLWQGGGGGAFVFILYVVAAGGVLALLYFILITAVFGIVGVFKQCYAFIFFGSRYPQLGALLEGGARPGSLILNEPPPTPTLPPVNFPAVEPPPVW
jgi:hypothetical protein